MTSLIIDKERLKNNINLIKSMAISNNNQCRIIGVVKGNGYGLDLIEYSKALIENGITMLAVSTVTDALKLRNAGINEEILMLASTSIEEEVESLIMNNIILTIGTENAGEVAEKICKEKEIYAKAHIKIDTGMGRYGFLYNDIDKIEKVISGLKYIKVTGMFSHFSNSFVKSSKSTNIQFNRFRNVFEQLKEDKIDVGILHICNTSAFLKNSEKYLDAVRIGSGLTRKSMWNKSRIKKNWCFKI